MKKKIKEKTARKRATGQPPEAAAAKKAQTKAARPAALRAAVHRPAVRKPAVAMAANHFELLTAAVPRVVATKARRGQPSAEFASFDDAKDRAIDFLIDFIADCEQQLWDLKRAESYEAYAAFLAAEESQKT